VPVEPGLSAQVELVVAEGDTALAMRSGDVHVLGTPRVVGLCEEATVLALDGQLATGQTSVGHTVQLDHVAPARVGTRVIAEATLQKVNGRRLTFTVSVNDPHGLIAAGILTRVVVDVDRFLDTAN
jgi:fluoroacetyl-CoA thioesterase